MDQDQEEFNPELEQLIGDTQELALQMTEEKWQTIERLNLKRQLEITNEVDFWLAVKLRQGTIGWKGANEIAGNLCIHWALIYMFDSSCESKSSEASGNRQALMEYYHDGEGKDYRWQKGPRENPFLGFVEAVERENYELWIRMGESLKRSRLILGLSQSPFKAPLSSIRQDIDWYPFFEIFGPSCQNIRDDYRNLSKRALKDAHSAVTDFQEDYELQVTTAANRERVKELKGQEPYLGIKCVKTRREILEAGRLEFVEFWEQVLDEDEKALAGFYGSANLRAFLQERINAMKEELSSLNKMWPERVASQRA